MTFGRWNARSKGYPQSHFRVPPPASLARWSRKLLRKTQATNIAPSGPGKHLTSRSNPQQRWMAPRAATQFAVSRIASTPGQFAIVYKKRSAMPAKTVSVCYFFSRSNGTYRDFGNSTWPPQSNDLETQGKIDAGSLLRVACWMFIVVCSNS